MACESGNQTLDRHIAGLDVELTAGEPLAVVLGGALAVAPLSSWQVGAACLSLSPSEPATEIDAQLTEATDPEAPEDSLAATFTAEQTGLILGCELQVHLDGRLVVKGRFVAARPQRTPRGSASIEVATSDAATAVIEVVQAVAVPVGSIVTVHPQPTSSVWVVDHEFSHPPTVILVDSAGDEFTAPTSHEPGRVTIDMTPAMQAGTVYLRG